MLKLISVNIGLPRKISWKGETILTGIFKEPVHRQVHVNFLNIEGDKQADLTVHGGMDKAIYAYAAEHYTFWKKELKWRELPWGMFGENLTVEGGLFESEVFVGDMFSVGSAELIAIQPRMPCYKLGIRFGTQRILKQFAQSRRYGVYFKVWKEGDIIVGEPVQKIFESKNRVSIADIGRLLMEPDPDPVLLKRAASIEILPERFRKHFESLLG